MLSILGCGVDLLAGLDDVNVGTRRPALFAVAFQGQIDVVSSLGGKEVLASLEFGQVFAGLAGLISAFIQIKVAWAGKLVCGQAADCA